MEFSIFEVGMLGCFGASWPAAVYKTYTSKVVSGKSVVFLWLVFFGYVSGILHKVFFLPDWVIAIYLFNGFMVGADIALYYVYRKNSPAAVLQAEGGRPQAEG